MLFQSLFAFTLPLLAQTAVASVVVRRQKPEDPKFAVEGSAGSSVSNATANGLVNALYLTNWADYQPHQLPADMLTHVLYAFASVTANGTIESSNRPADLEKRFPGDGDDDANCGNNAYGNVWQLFQLKKKHRQMKTLLSIGGYTASQEGSFNFAETPAGRKTFAASAVKIMSDWAMDGVDIDWESPRNSTEAEQLVSLLKACREALDAYATARGDNYHYLLTAATPAGPTFYGKLDLSGMDPYLDLWNLMNYDYAGSWDKTTGHQAAVFVDPAQPDSTKASTDRAVDDYIASGIPPKKVVMGLPLYGRAFTGTTGPGEPYTGLGGSSEGTWLYRDLPRPGATEHFDNKTGAAWSYSAGTYGNASSSEFVTYDNVESARFKASYVRRRELAGTFFWDASGDKTGAGSLVGTTAKSLGGLDCSENMLNYPKSQFDNIRNAAAGAS